MPVSRALEGIALTVRELQTGYLDNVALIEAKASFPFTDGMRVRQERTIFIDNVEHPTVLSVLLPLDALMTDPDIITEPISEDIMFSEVTYKDVFGNIIGGDKWEDLHYTITPNIDIWYERIIKPNEIRSDVGKISEFSVKTLNYDATAQVSYYTAVEQDGKYVKGEFIRNSTLYRNSPTSLANGSDGVSITLVGNEIAASRTSASQDAICIQVDRITNFGEVIYER